MRPLLKWDDPKQGGKSRSISKTDNEAEPVKMGGENQLAQAFQSLSIVDLARELGLDLKEGTGQKSPFRDDKHAGSFAVYRSSFKDYAVDEHSGKHLDFVKLARPDWSKKECIEFVIRAAGMEPARQSAGRVKEVMRQKRIRLYRQSIVSAETIPSLNMPEPPELDAELKKVWSEGQTALSSKRATQLAKSRGWAVEVMESLTEQGKTATPVLPWGRGRGWGWLVEKPVYSGVQASLVPVGFHMRYKFFSQGKEPERRWVYVPYVPAERSSSLSGYQPHLKKKKVRLPAYPFVLGDLSSPRLVVVLEGQFDAVSLAEAFGWLRGGFPPGVVVFGLRGAQSPDVLLAAYGRWLKKYRPFVWILPDNDTAGLSLFRRKNPEKITSEPCFIDRVRALGCEAKGQIIRMPDCKDFNDIWRAFAPGVSEMQKLADVAGCGGLIK